jgi:ketol-acid reductoisomerase
MAKINFGGTIEHVVTREEFHLTKALELLKNETLAVLGYGTQGMGQSLNLKDNGFHVIVGQRKNTAGWKKAIKDGWKEGVDLFPLEIALQRGTIILYLLSDAGQIECWPMVKKYLTEGKTLHFSHGFGIVYSDKTGIIPPKNIDITMIAPKGSGTSLRKLFLEEKGLNSSYAVFQDHSGIAKEKAFSIGIGIGSGYLFETTFQNEVYSDLTGERGILMGAVAGLMEAQYNLLRKKGHTPSEAFNETVEELTQSLIPLIGENGMDWMYANCSTTAQRGALDWKGKFRKAVAPLFDELYESVISGKEAEITIKANRQNDYREKLQVELDELRNSELWQSGIAVRNLRPLKFQEN